MARNDGVGIALAGGVVEGGFYEVGVLCALSEAVEGLDLNGLDVYVGVSAGAAIASLLANGVDPRTLSQAILERSHDKTLDLSPDVMFTPAWREYATRLLKVPGILTRSVVHVISGALSRSAWGLMSELGPALPTAIFDGRGVERFLSRAFAVAGRTNDFRELRAKLRIVAVQLDTSELVAFGVPENAHVPISKAVQASTALPGLFSPVEIDGELYIDGVARRTMNASLGLKEGARLMICINPIVPVKMDTKAAERRTLADYGLPAVISQTFRTIVHSRMVRGIEIYEHVFPDSDLVLIEPRMEDTSMFFSNIFSFSNRQGVTEHAYQSTRAWLLDEFEHLAPLFARHGLTLRRDVLAEQRSLYAHEGELSGTRSVSESARRIADVTKRLDRAIERLLAA